jgi:hypothetical protein
MKNLSLICLFLSVILIPQISHSSTLITSDDVKEDIVLNGSLADESVRSVFQSPIQAVISSLSLDVVFLYNVGNINVEVYTASGSLVYQNNVNTQTQQNLSIDLSDWDSGIYQIRFTNSEGRYMYGSFEIE